ncbi:hypothetical protein AAF712_001277 [Marasmius tenuissimus]|uniref:Cyclin-D1-binding protein 1 n=1 Tax=Marasmius tenuissimus TaxID=585030 RepID=A0ABR3AD08_9AGAR
MAERTHINELLEICVETCNAAVDQISNSSDQSIEKTNDPRPSLAIVHKDLLSLLALTYASTTKIALVLKPSSPTFSAAVTPLNDLIKHISALAHCVTLFDPDEDGATLKQEVTHLVTDVAAALKGLFQTFLEIDRTDGTEYLMKTGTVHQLIEEARSPSGVSNDNVSAVLKKWKEDTEPLEDGVRELKELIDNVGDVDGEDDGWDELGLEPDTPLSESEVDRASKVHLVLRLSALLHKRISSDILARSSDTIIPAHQVLDRMPSLSQSLLSAADELVATSHPPQNPSIMGANLRDIQAVIRSIETAVHQSFPEESVETAIEDLSLKDGGSAIKISKKKKWFDGCFEQLAKAVGTAQASFSDPEVQ